MLLIVDRRCIVGECLKGFLKPYFADLQIVTLTSAYQAEAFAFSPVGCILVADAEEIPQLEQSFPRATLLAIHDGRTGASPVAGGDVATLSLDMPAEAFVQAVRAAAEPGASREAPAAVPLRPVPSYDDAAGEDEVRAEDVDESVDAVLGGLSGREREVLAALKRGLPNKVIACELQLSENTVKIHVRNVMRKLGVTNRTMAALRGASAHGQARAIA